MRGSVARHPVKERRISARKKCLKSTFPQGAMRTWPMVWVMFFILQRYIMNISRHARVTDPSPSFNDFK